MDIKVSLVDEYSCPDSQSQPTAKFTYSESAKRNRDDHNSENRHRNSRDHKQHLPSPRIPFASIANHPQKIEPGKTPLSRDCSPRAKSNLLSLLEKKEVVGKGGFGKVWRVEVKGSGKSLALKEMSKALYLNTYTE